MHFRINPLIVHFIWGLGGLTLGASLSLLVIKNWTPAWIEATGTWFGAVATVLTLLWAVRSFRSDQAQRETLRREDLEKDMAARAERERAHFEEARNVKIALQGGAAYGGPPNQMMTSFHLTIHNHAKYDVVINHIILDAALRTKRPLPGGIHIPAGETFTNLVETADVPAHANDLSGQPMSRFAAEMSYRLDGRDWRRSSQGDPERLEGRTD